MAVERRSISQQEADDQKEGSTRIATGIWVDRTGHVHFSIPELLAMVDLEDTEQNRKAVLEIAIKTLQAKSHDIVVQDVERG